MYRVRTVPLLSILLPLLLGVGSGTLLSREAAPVPTRLRGPLPARIDLAALSTTEALRSLGLRRLPQQQHVRQRLCRGDAAERERFRDGLARALAEPGAPLRAAYFELAGGCDDVRDHCEWLASEADGASGAAADLLWSALASCWPLDDPGRFERAGVPDDAVVSFYAKREHIDRVHSARLAAVVERRVGTSDASALENALIAYARMDHPTTARHLMRLHAASADDERRYALTTAMRYQSDPEASRLFHDTCTRRLDASMEAWRNAGASPRGSPTRWGNPCDGGTDGLFERPPPSEAAPNRDPLDAIPETLGRHARLDMGGDFQFSDHTGLLRQLADLLRPDLDEAFFDDVWPAADAVRLYRGPHQIQVFVNGDGVTLGVPERDGAPDLAVAAAITNEVTAALREPRILEVWWRGEQFRFAHRGTSDNYDVNAALAITNFLLEETGTTRRVARLATEAGLAVLVAEPAGMARARAQGLLVETADSPTASPRGL
jgi:hypothetical protein